MQGESAGVAEKLTCGGVLDCCTHVFCFTCVKEWSKVTNCCPFCKRRYNTIKQLQNGSSAPGLIIKVKNKNQTAEYTEQELADFFGVEEESSDYYSDEYDDDYSSDGDFIDNEASLDRDYDAGQDEEDFYSSGSDGEGLPVRVDRPRRSTRNTSTTTTTTTTTSRTNIPQAPRPRNTVPRRTTPSTTRTTAAPRARTNRTSRNNNTTTPIRVQTVRPPSPPKRVPKEEPKEVVSSWHMFDLLRRAQEETKQKNEKKRAHSTVQNTTHVSGRVSNTPHTTKTTTHNTNPEPSSKKVKKESAQHTDYLDRAFQKFVLARKSSPQTPQQPVKTQQQNAIAPKPQTLGISTPNVTHAFPYQQFPTVALSTVTTHPTPQFTAVTNNSTTNNAITTATTTTVEDHHKHREYIATKVKSLLQPLYTAKQISKQLFKRVAHKATHNALTMLQQQHLLPSGPYSSSADKKARGKVIQKVLVRQLNKHNIPTDTLVRKKQ